MTVVTDTTAVTTLLKAGEDRLLREIFGNVIVPQAVRDELLAFHSHLPDFVLRRSVQSRISASRALNRWAAVRPKRSSWRSRLTPIYSSLTTAKPELQRRNWVLNAA